VLKVLQDLMV
jgi:hypothetical protein